MRFRILIIIILTIFIYGCNAGPDYKRDNLFDPEADTPNARFLYPTPGNNVHTDIDNYRGAHEYNSFIIQVNAAVINQGVTLELVSDKDGELFSTDDLTSDILKIDESFLSQGIHEITLLLNKVKTDQVTSRVNLPSQVRLFEPTWNNFQPKLKWSKYKGDDFESYKLKIIETRKAITVKEFTDINDTVFTHYEFPIRENFRYYIETTSNKHVTSNSSNQIAIKPNVFEYPYSSFLIAYNNQLHFYYSTCIYETGSIYECFLNTFSSKNESKTKSINTIYGRGLAFSYSSTTSDLLAISGGDIYRYNSRDLTLISEIKKLSEKVDTDPSYPIDDDITDIHYHQHTSNYFITFGNRGPYTFDSNFEPLENNLSVDDESATLLLGTNGNVLFATDTYRSGNLISYSFNQSGDLTKVNEKNSGYGFPIRALSKKHNKLFVGGYGKIFSADLNIDELGYLPDVNNRFTDFLIKESSQDTLFASTYDGYLYKIHIPTNQIVFTQKYHYGIKNILNYNNKIFLILFLSDYEHIIVPLKPVDSDI